MNTSKELATQEPSSSSSALSAPNLIQYRSNRKILLEVMEQEMKPGIDYGITPGTDKPALWKPGAEKLVSMFAFAPSFSLDCERLEDRHRIYNVKCTLKHRGTDTFLGDADAVCSTLETKYAKRKDWTDNEGVLHIGAPNNPADYYNTCTKMGEKRALIAVVLFVTGASDIFSQDIDDDDEAAAKGPNGGARLPQDRVSRAGRGVDTPGAPKAAAGLWTGTMAGITVKTFKNKDGKDSEYFILNLMDGRSASTFDTAIAEQARGVKGQMVKMGTKAGKKAGFFNVESLEALGPAAPAKEETDKPKNGQQEPDDSPFPD